MLTFCIKRMRWSLSGRSSYYLVFIILLDYRHMLFYYFKIYNFVIIKFYFYNCTILYFYNFIKKYLK